MTWYVGPASSTEGDERGAEFAAQLLSEERLTLIVISPSRFISWKEGRRIGKLSPKPWIRQSRLDPSPASCL